MAPKKPQGLGSLSDDAIESIIKLFGKKTAKKVLSATNSTNALKAKKVIKSLDKMPRSNPYNSLPKSELGGIAPKVRSKIEHQPKVSFGEKLEAGLKSSIYAKPKGKVVTQKAQPAPARPKAPKKTLTPPVRPKYNYVPKGKKMAQTTSEQKAAERMANKRLRMAGDTPSKPKSAGTTKPVDARGSVIKPPDKPTMRPSKPSRGSYEGDKMAGQAKDDAARIGRGQKSPKKKRK